MQDPADIADSSLASYWPDYAGEIDSIEDCAKEVCAESLALGYVLSITVASVLLARTIERSGGQILNVNAHEIIERVAMFLLDTNNPRRDTDVLAFTSGLYARTGISQTEWPRNTESPEPVSLSGARICRSVSGSTVTRNEIREGMQSLLKNKRKIMSDITTTQTLEIQLPLGTVHRQGLELPANLAPAVFAEQVMQPLKAMSEKIADSALWWWGDALAYRETTYGTKYDEAEQFSGYANQTLRNASVICRNIELSRRRDILSFSHHADIASAFSDPAEQDAWLDKAEQNQWSVKDLRLAIRAAKAEFKGENELSDTAEFLRPVTAFKKTLLWFEAQKPETWSETQKSTWRADLRKFLNLVSPILED